MQHDESMQPGQSNAARLGEGEKKADGAKFGKQNLAVTKSGQ